ncbi:hypothetical protein [Gorillibacterium sp. sgz500922]|uniref:hypothetical protein n=1 Tax=Gorillibacterium sp. sgz500922 TaxID=3446694 RepID=UPI003F663812
MKITGSQSGAASTAANTDQPLELRKGETYQAIVKEKKSANEAVVQIRGKEVAVKADGLFPASGETVTLTIQGQEAGSIKVKLAESGKSGGASGPAGVSSASGDSYTANAGQVAKLLADKGIPLTRETSAAIQRFMETAAGTVEEKLDSLRALLGKGLEVTGEQLLAVHAALHGEPLSAQLERLAAATAGSSSRQAAALLEARQLAAEIIRQAANLPGGTQLAAKLGRLLGSAAGSGSASGASSAGAADTVAALKEALRLLQTGDSSRAAAVLERLLRQASEEEVGRPAPSGSAALWQAFGQAAASSADARTAGMVELLGKCAEEPNLSRVVYEAKDRLLAADAPDREQWEQTLSAVRREQLAGRDDAARALLADALREAAAHSLAQTPDTTDRLSATEAVSSPEAEDRLSALASKLAEAAGSGSYERSGELASLGLSSQTVVVTQVTARLARAANEFRSLKREISRSLDHLARLAEASPQAASQAKGLLDASIDLLDKAILKSDITSLTDMGTEKKLLLASSQLASARKHLLNGNAGEARQVFERVKADLDAMNWKPADVKVRHLLTGESARSSASSSATAATTATSASASASRELVSRWEAVTSTAKNNEGSARQVFESLRALGLNRDSETAQRLAASSPNDAGTGSGSNPGQGQAGREPLDANLKSILLRLAQDDASPAARPAEQALQSLTGQQLLSKTETGSPTQSLMFQLPLPLNDRVAPVNVFVQSRKEGDKMDWENCSLYFALETEKLGGIGIQLTSVDRTLSITMKNDRSDFKQRMEPLVASCKDKLQALGYRVSQIQYTPLTPPEEAALPRTEAKSTGAEASSPAAAFSKGFDFKV